MAPVLLEICVDSPDGAVAAAAAGADRIELCAALETGGLTPSAGLLAVTRSAVALPLMVLLRPRAGDFCYSPRELAAMAADLDALRDAGADGVVLGALRPDGRVDREAVARLVARARPMAVTFHRAFDHAADPLQALDTLRELGIERLLTSGQAPRAAEALPLLADLVRLGGPALTVMPGGGVRAHNAAAIVAATGCRELHSSAGRSHQGPMLHRTAVSLRDAPPADDHARRATDPAEVAALAAILRG